MTSTYSPLLRGDHFVSRDLCPASLVERTRLAGHKQSFLNLLRQNGRHVTKVCWIWNETDVLSVLINPFRLVGRPHKLPYVMPVTQFKLIKWKKINAVLLALFCNSYEKKAWKKNSGVYEIQTLDSERLIVSKGTINQSQETLLHQNESFRQKLVPIPLLVSGTEN